MKRTRYRCSVGVIGIALACCLPEGLGSDRAGDLIQEAHQHDGMYHLGPQISPDRAISLYHEALQVHPNDRQRLHILYRLSQLYVYSERPDNYAKAIELNQQVLEEFPTDELAVLRAMNSLTQNHRALGQHVKALEWARRIIDHHADPNQTARSPSAPGPADTPPDFLSHKRAQEVRQYKEAAVENVAFLGSLVDPLVAEAELRRIVAEHPGTYLADEANQVLREIGRGPSIMAGTEDRVHLPWEGVPADAGGTTLQTGSSATLTNTDHNPTGEADSRVSGEPTRTNQGHPAVGDVTCLAQAHDGSTRTSRGPPSLYLAAGLSLAAAVSFRVYVLRGRKMTKFKEV